MNSSERPTHRTVSEVLGAHAAVQIAQAQVADMTASPPPVPAARSVGGFTQSWASVSMCIGWGRSSGE